MASGVTDQIVSQSAQLAQHLENLYHTITAPGIESGDQLAHLIDIEREEASLRTMESLTKQIDDTSDASLTQIAMNFSKIKDLLGALISIKSNLERRVEQLPSSNDSFLRSSLETAVTSYFNQDFPPILNTYTPFHSSDALLLQLERELPRCLAALSSDSKPLDGLEKKLQSIAMLQTMSALTEDADMGSLQESAIFFEENDPEASRTLFNVQNGLHEKLEKAHAIPEYGRLAFFNQLPLEIAGSNASPAERLEVINRTLVFTLIEGIKEAIGDDNIDQFRGLMVQFSAVRLNADFQTYRNENLVCLYDDYLVQCQQGTVTGSSLLNDKELKVLAIQLLEAELLSLWLT